MRPPARGVTAGAWALCLFTCACMLVYLALYGSSEVGLWSVHMIDGGFPFIPVAAVLGAVLGALIVSRYPRNVVGWLLLIGQAGTAFGLAADSYSYRVLSEHAQGLGSAQAGHLAAWLSVFFGATYALSVTCALFLLVPDGRLLSRRWAPVLAAAVLSPALGAGVMLLAIPPSQVTLESGPEPSGPVPTALLAVTDILLLLAILGSAVALVLRLRRSTGMQRQQLRWITASAGLLALATVEVIVYQAVAQPTSDTWQALVPLYAAYASLPVCTGIAVLRYRLYDIDVIINRAVVLAALVLFVTGGYVAVVVVIGAAMGATAGGQFWPSLVATMLVALAFQPLRRRVLRLADRLVYGSRAAPYEALAEFSRRIGESPSTAELLPRLAEAVGRSVGAAHAEVQLNVRGGSGLSAGWPDRDAQPPDWRTAVTDRGEPLGDVAVTMPPGRGLRAHERRLLERFAEHAGVVFRNARLEAELQARVLEVAAQAQELAASRRRLLMIRDAERRRVARLIHQQVLTHLEPMPQAIDALPGRDPAQASETLDRLAAATEQALDALREVTQGIFPAVLTRRGLPAALRAHLEKSGMLGALSISPELEGRRFDMRIEAVVYFCCVATLQSAREAGHRPPATVLVQQVADDLELTFSGYGDDAVPGWAAADALTSIRDRIESAGGTVRVDSPHSKPTTLVFRVPCGERS
jgi:signal transduction histidine kinase